MDDRLRLTLSLICLLKYYLYDNVYNYMNKRPDMKKKRLLFHYFLKLCGFAHLSDVMDRHLLDSDD